MALNLYSLRRVSSAKALGLLFLVTSFSACDSGMNSVPAGCPSITVETDAGTDAFSGVGDSQMGPACERFCDKTQYPVCELLAAHRVKCQAGCL